MAVSLAELLSPQVIKEVIGRIKTRKAWAGWPFQLHLNLPQLRKKIRQEGTGWIKGVDLVLTKAALDWLVKKYPEVGEPLLLNKIAGKPVEPPCPLGGMVAQLQDGTFKVYDPSNPEEVPFGVSLANEIVKSLTTNPVSVVSITNGNP